MKDQQFNGSKTLAILTALISSAIYGSFHLQSSSTSLQPPSANLPPSPLLNIDTPKLKTPLPDMPSIELTPPSVDSQSQLPDLVATTSDTTSPQLTPPKDIKQPEIALQSPPSNAPNCTDTPQALPINNATTKYWNDSAETVLAPLSIETAPGSQTHSFIKIVDPTTNQPIGTLFVQAGQSAKMQIPIGSYEIKVAQGREWCSFATHFGKSTAYSRLQDVAQNKTNFDFKIDAQSTLGWTFQLKEVLNGNLETQPISAEEF